MRRTLRVDAAVIAFTEACGFIRWISPDDPTLTLNTYSHVLPALQQDAAARMNELLVNRA